MQQVSDSFLIIKNYSEKQLINKLLLLIHSHIGIYEFFELSTTILIKKLEEVIYYANSFTSEICQLTNHSRREDARN